MKTDFLEILNKIKAILNMEVKLAKEIKLGSSVLNDGTTIYYDGEMIVVGSPIFSDEALTTVVPDGEYPAEEYIIVVVDGLVSEIKEVEVIESDETEVPAEPVEESMTEMTEMEKENLMLKELISELKGKLEQFSQVESNLKAQIEKLSVQPSVEPLNSVKQEVRELTDIEKRLNSLSAIKRAKKIK